jgi:hypothetical protein
MDDVTGSHDNTAANQEASSLAGRRPAAGERANQSDPGRQLREQRWVELASLRDIRL